MAGELTAHRDSEPTPGGKVDLGGLDHSLGFLIRMAQVRLYEHFFATTAEGGPTPGEFAILWVIGRNPGIRQGLLCQTLSIKPAHMTKTVRRLEMRGLLAREVPDSDRRSVMLTLTEDGRRYVDAHRKTVFSTDAGIAAALSPQETGQLVALLLKLNSGQVTPS